MNIKLTKLSAVENPNCPTPSKEDYNCGQNNGDVSLFNGYTIVGEILEPPKEGESLRVLRQERNGVKLLGVTRTSMIQKIEGNKLYTENSVYEIEYLND